jgi:hypothetical protein
MPIKIVRCATTMSRLWSNGSGFSTRLIDTRSSGAMRTSERIIVIRASSV